MLEWFLPWRQLSKILPRQAALRLFHAPENGFMPSEFYDGYANLELAQDEMRKSKVQQITDIFKKNNISLSDKKILDVSGGPGEVAYGFKEQCSKFVVTEYSQTSVTAMKNGLGVDAVKFDYISDDLSEIVDDTFDVVMIRSSIIFCSDLGGLLLSINKVLKPEGLLLLETITPSLGEVFWWQQMEYKFPVIYSQMAIESAFVEAGFSLMFGYRETGSYEAVKWRGQKTLGRRIFTWLVDYPMVLIYWFFAPKRRIPIDTSLDHKFLTQLWRNKAPDNSIKVELSTYRIGGQNRSPHYSCIYNGYLTRDQP